MLLQQRFGSVDTQACRQQEVVFNARWLFCFSLLCLSVLFGLDKSGPYMIPLIYIRELEFLHLDMPEIHCAHLTANEREGCLDRIKRFACLGYPLMSVSSRKNTDDTCLPLTIGSHEAIDHLT